MNVYCFSSPAKINLYLRVICKRKDGYHEIESLVSKISLFDVIKVQIFFKKSFMDISFSNNDNIPENNTIYKAVKYFKDHVGMDFGCAINVFKNIPMEAGLGGGSSNAGVILKFLNSFFKTDISKKDLIEIGKKIGADVPLFIEDGSLILMKGIGDITKPINMDFPDYWILIVKPSISISTEWAYKSLKLGLTNKPKNSIGVPPLNEFKNDFEEVILPKFEELQFIKNSMKKNKAKLSLLTGSGSSIFGLFENKEDLLKCKKILQKDFNCYIVKKLY